MKVLSLWQPHATLMALQLKKIETRHWQLDFRGPVIIHAAKRNETYFLSRSEFAPLRRMALPLGAALAIGELINIHRVERIRDTLSHNERAYGDYGDGRYGWVFENVRVFPTPIPMKGQQGLFDFDMDKHLFDMVVQDAGWYQAALDTLIAIRNIKSLRLHASQCKAPIIRQLCAEALERLGEKADEIPQQLNLF